MLIKELLILRFRVGESLLILHKGFLLGSKGIESFSCGFNLCITFLGELNLADCRDKIVNRLCSCFVLGFFYKAGILGFRCGENLIVAYKLLLFGGKSIICRSCGGYGLLAFESYLSDGVNKLFCIFNIVQPMCIELAAFGEDSFKAYLSTAVFFGVPTVKVVIFLSRSGENGELSVFLCKEQLRVLFAALVIEVNLLLTQEREEFIGINALYILLKLFAESVKCVFCFVYFYFFLVGNRELRRKCSDKLFNCVHSFKLSHSFNALSQFSFELFVELRLFVFSESVKEAFCVLNVALVGIFELFGCWQSLYELFNCAAAAHNCDFINMRNNFQCIVARHGRPCRIAAGNIDYIALFY